MALIELRPKLVSFRELAFHGENREEATRANEWPLDLTREINLGLAVPMVLGAPLQAVVKIELRAKPTHPSVLTDSAEFSAVYEARFDYPSDATEEAISPLFEHEPHQYALASQTFPLAVTHFRRELQSMGFDAHNLPLGL